ILCCTAKIGRLLKKWNIINIVFTIIEKIAKFPKTINLQRLELYNIPYVCGKVSIDQTERHLSTRLKEYKTDLGNNNFEKLAVTEHRAETKVLVRETRFWTRLYRESCNRNTEKSQQL
ncbi:hypothetical protein NQ315_012189, partial [Exocentrus adspersus]